jgi:hypothetical protein
MLSTQKGTQIIFIDIGALSHVYPGQGMQMASIMLAQYITIKRVVINFFRVLFITRW